MKREGSLPRSQESATEQYSDPDKLLSKFPTLSFNYILILSSHLSIGIPSSILP
jgi:hypothetical protein